MSFYHWLVMTATEKRMGENLIEKEGDPPVGIRQGVGGKSLGV